ncbi:ABC transporter ATP-binding protein [Geoalkalibacter sp.]|uniref:ABC transporter ATP-binding protein n=1 Tax=Geoalkalibacter sp. TaxID=3041440 RepID=UPI00272DE31C|nr:ABC transporter ATP-binding protein [Geoalkalibacter sp.]
MIKVEGLGKTYRESMGRGRVLALQDVSFEVPSGEVFGFLGPNGAGKSTTIKILLNLIRPDAGLATILGTDVRRPELRRQVGFLPENPYFYDYLSAWELLKFGGRTAGMDEAAINKRGVELLERVNLLAAAKRHLRTYSKGMVQRAGLALALIHDPQVVILDEPMSGLDPLGRKMVGDLIMELKSQGKTVLFSSHVLTDVERFCDRAAIIVNGRLRLVGALKELLSAGGSLEDVFLREVEKAGGGQGL